MKEVRRAAARLAEIQAIAARPAPPHALPSQVPVGPGRTGVNPSGREVDLERRLEETEDQLDTALAVNDAQRRQLLDWVTRYRVSPESVRYRPGSEQRHCGNCVMYHDRSCDLVRGQIDPDAVCDRWEAKIGA